MRYTVNRLSRYNLQFAASEHVYLYRIRLYSENFTSDSFPLTHLFFLRAGRRKQRATPGMIEKFIERFRDRFHTGDKNVRGRFLPSLLGSTCALIPFWRNELSPRSAKRRAVNAFRECCDPIGSNEYGKKLTTNRATYVSLGTLCLANESTF